MTVGNMVRVLKIPENDALRLRKEFGNSDIPPYLFAKWRNERLSSKVNLQGTGFSDEDLTKLDTFLFMEGDELKKLVEFARRFPQMEKQLRSADNADDALTIAAEFMKKRGHGRGRVVVSFPDGYSWVELRGDDCEIEGGLMQHCGNAHGAMVSLRDKGGTPHVTMDMVKVDEFNETMANIDRSPDELKKIAVSRGIEWVVPQLRGKQNASPDKKYMPYVEAFVTRYKALVVDSQIDANTRSRANGWLRSGSSSNRTESVDEAPSKKEPTHLTAQRNVPREFVNAMTSQPSLRQTVWSLNSMPKGTQAARLMRYLEDKGWRRVVVSGRTLIYHARSLRLLDPVRPPNEWTLYGIYSMFRPRGAEPGEDQRGGDVGLMKMWGYRSVGETDDVVLNTVPSDRLIKFVSSPTEKKRAEDIADQLYQHTGIALEPTTVRFPPGKPVERAAQPASTLPAGVTPKDIIVVAEGGSFYAVSANELSTSVIHDSKAVLEKGTVKLLEKDPGPAAARADSGGESGLGSDWDSLMKRYGVTGAAKTGKKGSAFIHQPPDEADDSPDITVRGDGALSKIVDLAKSRGLTHVFFTLAGQKGNVPEVETTKVAFPYNRNGVYDEAHRVAANVRATRGLPVKPGRWEVSDLERYVQMFEQDFNTKL